MRKAEIGKKAGQRVLREALAAGERGVYDAFANEHRAGMIRIASRFLEDREVAEEVVQDTLEAVCREVDRFRGDASFKTWVYSILANRARSVRRREKRSVAFSALEGDRKKESGGSFEDRHGAAAEHGSGLHGAHPVDPQTAAINRQRLRILDEGLRLLPDRQREIVVLRDVEGRGGKEVAELLDISVGNQRVLLHRSRLALRSGIELKEKEEKSGFAGGKVLN
ncbi:MAG: sigma-70 family RNA polymerase sigma factor [Polyangia bacterium]